MQDIRYAFRLLLARPSFTAVAVLTLAIGLGANVAIFSLVSGVLLKPLPLKEPERLVVIWDTHPSLPMPYMRTWPSAQSSRCRASWPHTCRRGAQRERIQWWR